MHASFSRRAIAIATVLSIGTGMLGTSVTSLAQTSTFSKKSASIKKNFRLEEAVQKNFDKEKHLESSAIRIIARNGVVTLEGAMPDGDQIQRATEIATATPGVTSVTNLMTVREEGH